MLRRAVLTLGLSGLAAAVAADAAPPDWVITHNARRAITNDKLLAGLNLGVQVRNGEALVWGPVLSEEQRAEALARVKLVAGVERVVDELYVLSADHMLRRHWSRPVAIAPKTRATPTSSRGEGIAVRPVTDERPAIPIGVRALPSELADLVEDVRRSDARFARLQIQVTRGIVTISGEVRHAADVDELAERIRRLPGVADVVLRTASDRP